MKDLKGTRTEENLKIAFSGEAQARVKYGYYAKQAKKEGYEQISAIFEETSDNEKEHAKLWFKALHGGSVPTTAARKRPAPALASTGRRANEVMTNSSPAQAVGA